MKNDHEKVLTDAKLAKAVGVSPWTVSMVRRASKSLSHPLPTYATPRDLFDFFRRHRDFRAQDWATTPVETATPPCIAPDRAAAIVDK